MEKGKRVKEVLFAVVVATLLVISTGCTTPASRTKKGALIGTAVGTGLGAVVGGSAGSVAGGMILGSLTGAALGGASGNVLDLKAKEIDRKSAIIKEQEKILKEQEEELKRLRSLTKDSIAFNLKGETLRDKNVGAESLVTEDLLSKKEALKPQAEEETIKKSQVLEAESRAKLSSALPIETARFYESKQKMAKASKCPEETKKFISEGENAVLPTDKMYFYKKALRICPNSSRAHYLLGEVYLMLNKQKLAEKEFKEALKIDPSNAMIRSKLREVLALNREVAVF
ncbi:MAG: tetratricopeptide repeat protein [Candidatus Dadabacteria bacterium]|nr:MAG: tetratricopeptide repeat protein [Candidatus Dadabacteria bacterium]